MTQNRVAALGACLLGALACVSGCALQKAPPAQVLKNQDFIADPVTTPTSAPQEPVRVAADQPPAAPVSAPPISAAAASDGLLDVTAVPGAPTGEAPAAGIEDPQIVDAKLGEISGNPVRVDDVLSGMSERLTATARTRSVPEVQAKLVNMSPMENMNRDQFQLYATKLAAEWLMRHVYEHLLEEEARASLKPEEKQGLKYIVQEVTENARREAGGSAAAFERQQNKTEEQYKREQETAFLLQVKIENKLRDRIRISWKDIKQYYDHHPEIYNPPAQVTFRLIQVPAAKTEEAEHIQSVLNENKPFAEVATMKENDYNRSDGGVMPVQSVAGSYEQSEFFNDDITAAAHTLKKPGDFTKTPFDLQLGSDKYKAWLCLDSLKQESRPLSDFEVQLEIAQTLEHQALETQRKAYYERLFRRSSTSDLDAMATRIGQIATERYWDRK